MPVGTGQGLWVPLSVPDNRKWVKRRPRGGFHGVIGQSDAAERTPVAGARRRPGRSRITVATRTALQAI